MAKLVLGPLLRYVSDTEATVWVETSAPCEVEVLGRREPTFAVAGHHYALVRIEGLEPGGFYEYEVALDGERRWPAPDSRPAAERDPHLRRRQAARHRLRLLPRRAAARAALHADQGRGRRRPRARRPPRARRADEPRRPRRVAGAALPARRPGLRRRGLAADPARGSARAATSAAPRRGGRRLRGVHLALPRVLERPDDPLAVLDRLDLDGLGRPRHERRLEHLALLARGDGPQGVVARARRRRHHELLDLPAPRQPLAARARRERALRKGAGEPPTRPPRCAGGRRRSTRPPRAPAGATAATSTACGRSSWTRAPPGC